MKATVAATILVDFIIIALALISLFNLFIHINSFVKIIRFLSDKKYTRMALYSTMAVLSLLLSNEFVAVLMIFWGFPAFLMTQISRDHNNKIVNMNYVCVTGTRSEWAEARARRKLYAQIFSYSLSISSFSRCVWTLALFGGMIYL